MSKKPNSISDLQGAGRLTKDGVNGIVDIVEAIHYNIISLGGLLGNNKRRRRSGITSFVYKNIRTIASVSATGFDALTDKLALFAKEKEPGPKHRAVVAIINGVIGDYLMATDNSLATTMQFRYNRKSISSIDQITENSAKKIVLLVHGSCMNDLQWNRQGHDHGVALAQELNYRPVYLLYNSGRHISENGKELSEILEAFLQQASDKTELIILAHSMGGLVARSAVHYGGKLNYSWLKRLRKLICLGTPHHGAPLEKGGNWIDNILETNSLISPISRLGKIRSAGITDMRYGNIVDEDWNKHDRFSSYGDQRVSTPLPANTDCYTMAATIGNASTKLEKELVGDGLVPLFSALGKHKDPKLNLSFPPENQWVARNMKHLDLLSDPGVYTIIEKWIRE